jgi:hypothetical protein
MAIRTDIYTVDWDVSPRVIWIDISETEAIAQDLYDTLKHLEALHTGTDEPQICDAGGWEPLGGSVFVGITISLFNAVYAFADRPGPEWVICNMTGGNVVAFTDITKVVTLYPRKPTAYVSADRTASSSATTQEQQAIQFASYNGGITIDTANGSSGIIYPIGTPKEPVDNFDDLVLIQAQQGLPKVVFILGDIDITSAVPPLKRYTFIGEGMDRTTINIDTVADVENCAYFDAHVTGTLDGNSRLEQCEIDDLTYLKGFVQQCVLSIGTIVLGGGEILQFLDCWSGEPGISTPIIDLGGSGQGLSLRNYNGGIKLINKTGNDKISIDINSGQVILADTVVAGEIVCRGVGKLIDESGDYIPTGSWNGVTIINETTNQYTINEAVWKFIMEGTETGKDILIDTRKKARVAAGKL